MLRYYSSQRLIAIGKYLRQAKLIVLKRFLLAYGSEGTQSKIGWTALAHL